MGGFNLSACFVVESQQGARVFLTRVRALAWAQRRAIENDSVQFVYRQPLYWEAGEPKDGTYDPGEPELVETVYPELERAK